MSEQATARWTPTEAKRLHIHRYRSLAGCVCPECRGLLRYHKHSGDNICEDCQFVLVTEWEWERRQQKGNA